ncbi:DNRLRE domain-containing protein [Streptomyces sp. S3(2020)]|uniref:DNRLRE domain-containing protein n=1 Tax=Streptomyces sp. S3(2020) TaxID=2732044 RepID=UPI00148867ED|nr:DNRLRE domain-containing protein [Streptomyces sp. S3(2020)]NNN35362.1 DNRLRE domain-containing protein [Streptomyces sp. S3(2020)]
MAITLLDVASLPAAASAPNAPNAPAPKKAAATRAADIPSARVAARLSGKRVEALSERTETSTTWANKNGSLTTELSAGPIRFRQDGKWVDVDVELRPSGSGVEPVAHPEGLRLAGRTGTPAKSWKAAREAKATDLVTLGEGAQQITLQWKGGLPEPKLDGTRAEYVNAVPGADVVVEATRTGFEQFVEVKQRPSVTDYSYTLPLKAKGLKARQLPDGSVLFTDKKNKKRAVMPAPVMWDSTVDKRSGEHTHKARVGLKVVQKGSSVDLVVTPDAKFLADPETRFPVTVDPSTSSLSNVFDTYVQQGETVDWSTDTELDFGNPGTKNADGTPRTAQSFVSWNTTPVQDALVLDAKLSLWNFHSGNTDCKAYPWEVWSSGAASTSSRWTNRPTMTAKKATSTETRGNTACTSAPDGWVNADVTTLVQEWASANAARGHMGIRAADESVVAQWKRVNSANAAANPPKLVVNYNYRPRTGTRQEAGPPYFSYSGAYVVNSTTPTLRDTFVDADGDKVNGTFQIYDNATNAQVGDVIVSKYVPSGQAASVTVPSGVLANGKTYKFRTSPYDGTHFNTGWSAWKTFTVDTSAPSAPAKITSSEYPTGKWSKGAGQAGTFTVTPPASDHNWLEWSLDGVTWNKVATGGASGDKNLSVTPSDNGAQSLLVRTVDKADNRSSVVEYTFNVGAGGFVRPGSGDRTARRFTLEAETDGGKYDKVSFSWRRSAADGWQAVPVGHVTQDGTALTQWPVPLASGRNAPLAWNAASTVTPDGSVELKADFTGPGGAAGSTEPLTVVVDRNADGAANEDVGPGSVNLLTGDYTLSADDVSAFDLAVSRTAHSRRPEAGAQQEDQAAIFGKQWVSGFEAQLNESEYTHLERISDTAVRVVLADDSPIHFTANAARNGWIPEPGAEEMVLKGSVNGTFTLSDSSGTVTEFAKADPAASAWQVKSTLFDGLSNSTTTVMSQTVTVDGKELARPTRIIAATSAATASACAADPSTKGCRLLEYVYASSTTATSTALGDINEQVREIRLWSTEPGASAATSKAVQSYRYDDQGRLRRAWNPQISPALVVEYGYDSAGRVTSLTPPGELPWTFAYGKAGNDAAAGEGMLLKATRAALKEGTAGTVEGEATTSVVYDVPLSGASAPYAMDRDTVRTWGQQDIPTDATAVFPADSVPASHSGSALEQSAYRPATVQYLNVSGERVNLAEPGGRIDSTDHDRFGNVVRELSAGNRETALASTATAKEAVADLGLTDRPSPERAELLSTRSVYDQSGTRELEKFGPLGRIDLAKDLKSGDTTLVAAGTAVLARSWTSKRYDEGRPADAVGTSNQITSTKEGAQVREHPAVMADAQLTTVAYDWVKGLPTKVVQDPDGLAITTVTEYDAQGRVTRQGAPGTSGSDAGTQVSTYWSATGTGACAGRPEWADLLCTSGPAGDITGGGTNPAQLPAMTAEYDWWGNTAKTTEKAGTSTRAITRGYDAAGRPTTVQTTGLGATVPSTTTGYDADSGRAITTTSSTGGTLTRAYDKLGREISYSDADGGTTTTAYDRRDRPVKVANSVPSTATYTYDASLEPRGLATKVTDSIAGAFSATYDADGAVASEKLPGGYTLKQSKDAAGAVVERAYTRDSDGVTVYDDAATSTIHGQAATRSGWSHQEFGYDAAGRLTRVEDTSDNVCALRTYTLDSRSNRTGTAETSTAPGTACPTTAGTVKNRAYDSADRVAEPGYTYDAFGRTTALPGSTLSYYANDLVQRQTAGSQRQTWQLDSGLRFRSWTTETNNAGTWSQTAAKTNHYGNDTDSPSWIVEDTAQGTVTRNVTSATGTFSATTGKSGGTVLQLTGIHGDVALQLPLDQAVAPTVVDSNENGVARTGKTAQRYGWFGSNQRSGETLTGIVLMGARLYDPTTARFLQLDPVFGGNCNAYDFVCADPVNGTDLDGRCGAWGNPFKACDKWRILMWSRSPGSHWKTIREGSTSNVTVNGKKYGKFGLRHIKDKHVGKGKRSAWRSSSTMMSDLKKALISGKWRNAWGGVYDGKWDITYSYWTGCGCRKKKKYTVYVYYRTTAAPDGKPLGVTTAYINRTG